MDVQRWTGLVTAHESGGFVAIGDYLELKKANSDLAAAAIVPQGMKLIHWSEEDAEKGATAYIMNAVHEYGIACVNLHIRNREGFGNVEDERKHQQSIWCAIRDMVNNEIQMLQDACTNQSEQLSYWKGLALKDSKPMTNQLTGRPL